MSTKSKSFAAIAYLTAVVALVLINHFIFHDSYGKSIIRVGKAFFITLATMYTLNILLVRVEKLRQAKTFRGRKG